MRLTTVLLAFTLLAWLHASTASAYTIELNGYSNSLLTTSAFDGYVNAAGETVTPGSLPYAYTSTSIDGGASSESVFSLSDAGFNITFDHARTDVIWTSRGQTTTSIYFSPDQDISYAALGTYTAVDSAGRRAYLSAYLYDITTATDVFRNTQQSLSTPSESFVLGEAGGDDFNVNTGSLTGTLFAGRDYRYNVTAFIDGVLGTTNTSATAQGSVALNFTAVPEPGTGTLMGMGLAALAAARRRSGICRHEAL